MVFIYLATGQADFFDKRSSLPNVEDENPFDAPPKWDTMNAALAIFHFRSEPK